MQTSQQTESMRWQRGTFHTFYAKMKIRIGGKEEVSISMGDSFEYDGQVIKYAGMEISNTHLRSALEDGWYSMNPDDTTTVRAVRPTRDRAASQSVNRDLSRVQRVSGKGMDTDYMDEEVVMNVSDRRPQGTGQRTLNVPTDRAKPRIMTSMDNQRVRTAGGMPIEIEEQDGVTIGRVRTPATLKVDMKGETTDSSLLHMGNVVNQLESLEGSGFIPDKETCETHEGVQIKMNVRRMNRGGCVETGDESSGRKIGVVKHSTLQVRDVAGGVMAKKKPVNKSTKSIDTTQTPVKIGAQLDSTLSPRIRIARAIDPSFPDKWEFNGKLSARLAAAQQHGITPVFLNALYAAEGDQMRRLLEKTYPDLLGG
jgi:hypothetical protein